MSIPCITCPNTTCLPSSHSVREVVMKNCDPLVFGPELAIDRIPAPVFTSSAVVIGKITTLNHKTRDDSMKYTAAETESFFMCT
ncbi:Eukaryotic translation initiation factor 3 subunit E, variant 2 [Dermatophagoides farinae]|uniref:Eukaryotic translation initiation factor 3 subunit E, variant 2 n=1 Tax=Dermatophagoides farinae TaxID=6954 RepID=A0A922IEY1_DERFA|nr:Eukaryotic translation initiation factor 3 subunit E, variant 2 [Dermatophagoides farinae]